MSAIPRVTVGLPVYNGETFLPEALDSLLGQTYRDFELVISDNSSTDRTARICNLYSARDPRIRYIRQPRNIGLVRNHSFLVDVARGEFFMWASDDDLYGRDLLERCVEVLDRDSDVVLAHCRSVMIDRFRNIVGEFEQRVRVDAPNAPERFHSMLFDGWEDYTYGLIRTDVLRSLTPRGSYHYADRTLNTELALHGPFHIVPECLFFRREHAGRAPLTVRSRAAILDPRRTNRFRHPVVRLYGEYLLGYVRAIRGAPLTPGERRRCYRILMRWMTGRAAPVAGRTLRRAALQGWEPIISGDRGISVDAATAVGYRAVE